MKKLPMADDQDLANLALTVSQSAVEHGFLSSVMRQEMVRLNRTEAAKTLQWRCVAPLATATVKRLRDEGMSVPALAGFFAIGAQMDLDVFRAALADLQERFIHDAAVDALPLALDYAAAKEPGLSKDHLTAVCLHIQREKMIA
jgi:hypothetical protein